MGGGRAAGGGRRGGGQRRAGRGRGAAPARRSTWPRPARRTCSALGAPRRPVGSALRAAADRASSASAAALPRATRRRRKGAPGSGCGGARERPAGLADGDGHLVNLEGTNWAFKGESVIAAERPHHWRVSKRVQSSTIPQLMGVGPRGAATSGEISGYCRNGSLPSCSVGRAGSIRCHLVPLGGWRLGTARARCWAGRQARSLKD